MSWFDAGALVVVALAILDGAVSGLAWAVLELVLLVVAALLAGTLRTHVEPYVIKVADLPPQDAPWAAHVVVFALAACMLLGALVLVHPTSKKWRFRHDRWFGAGLGVVNGVVAALILCSLALWSTPRPYEADLAASRLVAALDGARGAGLTPLFPDYLPARLDQLRR